MSARPNPGRGLTVLLILLLTASCGTTTTTTTTTTPTAAISPARPTSEPSSQPAVAPVRWTDCGEGFLCASLRVPRDHAVTGSGTLNISLTRLPATGKLARIGSLVLEPGGPGASDVEFVRDSAKSFPAPSATGSTWSDSIHGASTPAAPCAASTTSTGGQTLIHRPMTPRSSRLSSTTPGRTRKPVARATTRPFPTSPPMRSWTTSRGSASPSATRS